MRQRQRPNLQMHAGLHDKNADRINLPPLGYIKLDEVIGKILRTNKKQPRNLLHHPKATNRL
jgi:hypothetical protein